MENMIDLDEFGQHGQYGQIDAQMDDIERVMDRKNAARLQMQRQAASDDIKSALCDKLRAEKMSVVGLDRKVKDLEDSDPDLFKYIRKLEFVQDGIWCSTCNRVKNIGGRPTVAPTVTINTSAEINILADRQKELRARIDSLADTTRAKLDKLLEYSRQIDDDIKRVGVMPSVQVNNNPPPKKESIVCNEPLPPKPTFDLSAVIDEKFKAAGLSADDLLG